MTVVVVCSGGAGDELCIWNSIYGGVSVVVLMVNDCLEALAGVVGKHRMNGHSKVLLQTH